MVSLVPSLTEAVAAPRVRPAGRRHGLVQPPAGPGRHPGARGTKCPGRRGRRGAAPGSGPGQRGGEPAVDLDALRAAGLAVWVTAPRTVAAGAGLARADAAACRLARPRGWPRRRPVGAMPSGPPAPGRRPDLAPAVDGGGAGHLRRRRAGPAGGGQRVGRCGRALSEGASSPSWPPQSRCGRATRRALRLHGADDGPEAFPGVPAALVSGRHLTWYGPSLVEAPEVLPAQLAVG